jgi:hypothetical protein
MFPNTQTNKGEPFILNVDEVDFQHLSAGAFFTKQWQKHFDHKRSHDPENPYKGKGAALLCLETGMGKSLLAMLLNLQRHFHDRM